MMNKEGFLAALQARIAVLEDAEQQDILAEYAQHIDLRVAGGLTEEDAIRDFGDPDQLAAEILEAYHVKPAFSKGAPGAKAASVPDPRPALRGACRRAGGFLRRCGGGIARFFRSLGSRLAALFSRCGRGLKRLFRRRERPQPPDIPTENGEECAAMERQPHKKPEFSGASRAAGRAGRGIGRFFKAAARLAWNFLLLICALPFVLLGLSALVCLGIFVVLLFQGYPLAGAVICCVGGAACCAGALGLGGSLIWRGSRTAVPAACPSAEPQEKAGEPSAQELSVRIRQTVQEPDRNDQEVLSDE